MVTYPSVLFIPCTMDGCAPHTDSALIRAQWVARYWPGAQVYDGRQSLTEWDMVVFQKAYLTPHTRCYIGGLAEARAEHGRPLLAFDLCDPDFLPEEQRQRLLDVLPAFDFATAPTQPLVDWLAQYLPAYLVPDTYDPEALTADHTVTAWLAAYHAYQELNNENSGD
jgi:hypothetical protein